MYFRGIHFDEWLALAMEVSDSLLGATVRIPTRYL